VLYPADALQLIADRLYQRPLPQSPLAGRGTGLRSSTLPVVKGKRMLSVENFEEIAFI
jgi:hypothetical protein